MTATSWIAPALVFLAASCLLVGFVTPVMAILIVLVSVLVVQKLDIVVLSTAIALLGPGAFSIDARMFGRREILIPHTSRSQKP